MKNKIFTLIIVLILISGSVAFGWYWYNRPSGSATDTQTETTSLFPQGSIISTIKDGVMNTLNPSDSSGGLSYQNTNRDSFDQGIVLGTAGTATTSLVAYIKSNEGKISIYNLTDKKEIFQTDSTKIGLFDGQIRQTPTGYRILVSHSPDNQNYTNTILTISTRATTTPTQETKINDNQQAILSPDGNSVFYLHEDVSGVFGILKSLTTGQEKEIFRSPLSTWTLAWPNKDTITLQTKPGRGVDGYFYTLSTTGVLTSILNKTDSLVAKMSPDGKKVIYNKLDNTLSTYIYDIEKKTSYKLAIKTIVDKCSWFGNEKIYCLAPREALTENSLEDWYKGKTSFTDDLWTINADTKNAQKVGSLPTKLDGYNLFINSGETTAFTTNKLDGSVVMIPIQ